MTTDTSDTTLEIPCHGCGYDLRAHPLDGKCPECGASVAEARRLAAIPRRPAWRDSDPRWRRRVLAGTWVLVLMPVVDVLLNTGWAARLPVPNLIGFRDANDTLANSFLCGNMRVDQPLLFCVGVVLLFAKERGRQRGPLDWTRRWGVLCSYVISLLSAASVLLITALVAVGVGAVFMSMPRANQPAVTPWLVKLSAGYLRYGPYPKDAALPVLAAFSSAVIALACAPLYDALRSGGGPKWVALTLLAPLVLFALLNLARAGRYCLHMGGVTWQEVYADAWYFQPSVLVGGAARLANPGAWLTLPLAFCAEGLKWLLMLAIATCLTVGRWSPRPRGDVTGARPRV